MNREQLAAVETPGLVFVSAGAGTGKTTVLVERYVRAVCEQGIDVESILVVTYTERAAGELRTRIHERLLELDRLELDRHGELSHLAARVGHAFEASRDESEAQEHAEPADAVDVDVEVAGDPARAGVDVDQRDLDRARISTIHGFCNRLLRTHPFASGLDPRFRVLDESQARVIRSEAFRAALASFCGDGDPPAWDCSRLTRPRACGAC